MKKTNEMKMSTMKISEIAGVHHRDIVRIVLDCVSKGTIPAKTVSRHTESIDYAKPIDLSGREIIALLVQSDFIGYQLNAVMDSLDEAIDAHRKESNIINIQTADSAVIDAFRGTQIAQKIQIFANTGVIDEDTNKNGFRLFVADGQPMVILGTSHPFVVGQTGRYKGPISITKMLLSIRGARRSGGKRFATVYSKSIQFPAREFLAVIKTENDI